MGKRQLTTLAALLGVLAFQQDSHAAIDEAGMKYVSAGEGFGGSIRLNFLHKFQRVLLVGDERRDDTPYGENEWETNYGSSRLYLNGDIDLGNSWEATYYFEIRPNESPEGNEAISPGEADTALRLAYQDIGLRGPFGWMRLGTVESASSAIIPSADRTNDIGTSGKHLAEDYDQGIRWLSPLIKGFQVGASFQMKNRHYSFGFEDSTRDRIAQEELNDKMLDRWDVATAGSIGELVEVGFSYAKENAQDRDDADSTGFRVGVSHAQKNWGVSYNFHRYKAYNPYGIKAHENYSIQGTNERLWHYREYNSSGSDIPEGNNLPNGVLVRADAAANALLSDDASLVLDFNKHTTYIEHVLGANLLFGRFNFAVNYSLSTTENDIVDTSPDPGIQSLSYKIHGLRGDLAYNLGSKSKIIAAAKRDKFDKEIFDENTYYLMYRVDF